MPKMAAVIMAAGKGTRMKSKLPKVMHPLAGKPLIEHVLSLVKEIGIEHPIAILGHGREIVEQQISSQAEIVIQTEQLGTGHAVLQAMPRLNRFDDVLILSGDQPLLRAETLRELIRVHQMGEAMATVLTASLDNPYGLGRIVREGGLRIVEEKDATDAERLIREINTGTYCFNVKALKEALAEITPKNAQGEYYLTDVFGIFSKRGKKILTYLTDDSAEALGINSRSQLAQAEEIMKHRIAAYWMERGVTIVDPQTTYIGADVELAPDVTILPFTFLQGKTKVLEDVVIGPQTTLDSCLCKSGAQVSFTVAKEAVIGKNCSVGPYAYLRPGTVLEDNVKVGDFVEIKNSVIGSGSKVPHLSYIGDAKIGKGVNIGAGTITCNYDGIKKHPTIIGDHAFIGSNTNLVAPVEVGEKSVVGAGSTITKNVPAEALAVERSQQVVKLNWRRKK